MKIKKFLEKVAEEDRESLINDRDIEFLASIGVDYNKKREAAQNEPTSSYYRTATAFNYRALLISLACFAVAAITVALILYFYFKPAPPLHYFEDNFVEVESDLMELNEDLNLFSLTLDDSEYKCIIKKTYDDVSGDDLFFTLDFTAKQGFNKIFTIEVVVNNKYEHEALTYRKEPVETYISNYKIKYEENILSIPSSPFITAKCIGEMKIGNQWIYIVNFDEMAEGQSTFIDTLESIIQFK